MPSITYQANAQDGYMSYISVALPLPYDVCRESEVANMHIDGAVGDNRLIYGFYLMGEDALELFRAFAIFDIHERLPPNARITSMLLRQGTYYRPADDQITHIFIDPSQSAPVLPHDKTNFSKDLYPQLVARHDPPSGSIKFLPEAFPTLQNILKNQDLIKLCVRSQADVEGLETVEAPQMSSAENATPPTLTVNYELEEEPPPPECLTDTDCPTGMICVDGVCIEETEPPPEEKPSQMPILLIALIIVVALIIVLGGEKS